ncbi:1-(5-phosphoribosyl)-5-amino-4-imidazole- carboxylate (AIR) carboxylase [Thermodesulfatator indicus DSM 15286]|uniref:1-(5-phosphoribosyl)-5-amino-4-imidazole-carboxylate (AIR) carboxylase n=1 Tax=Thermodesulfatator indicus (strain DSM 15286 / JCM 11887 / CIR29812) TaxID=667014 RepID=F8A8C6_THEID|nr:nickel pincer cofactor biosynthesis protein LarB [Thermodesulfatator indicus]AEH43930.1 1-(5-phosphoribosyl)-5-amino-4-imidazole- carboxylate (AIR) carboxylase [Thermodesulfatator indicus DSM 15286]
MMREKIRKVLEALAQGKMTQEEAEEALSLAPFEDLGFARLDHHRGIRKHFPEVIYGPGKTEEELIKITETFLAKKLSLLITRVESQKAQAVLKKFPELSYSSRARLIYHLPEKREPKGYILIACGGTADLPVVEEARICAEAFGNRVEVIVDVGVAGVHRIVPELPKLRQARVIICVAGMEGALPSLVAGLIDVPIIAVPVSAGYGANFQGLAPLLTMLNSCAAGVAVVNIDNGFGAAYMASLINQLPERVFSRA